MKYYVTTTTKCDDEYTELETSDQMAAIQAARNAWHYLTRAERKKQTVEVREYSSKEFYENDGSCYELIDWEDYSAITDAVEWFNRDEGTWAYAEFEPEYMIVSFSTTYPNERIDPVELFEKYLPSCVDYTTDSANSRINITKF